MTAIMAGSLGGEIPPIRMDGLSVMSVVINATCNLQCRHCYLSPEGPPVGVRSEDWLRYLGSVFLDLRPHSLCFSGKEVFAVEESASLFFDALRLRDRLQADGRGRTRVGVITNATLLEKYRDHLVECSLDWLDVSIDGPQSGHDEVRGRGAFAKMARNLPWLVESLGDRIWVALTTMDSNVEAVSESVSALNRTFGLRRFMIGLYKPQRYTDATLRIDNVNRESRIMQALLALNEIKPLSPVEVRFELDSSDERMRRRLEDEQLLPREGVLRVGVKQFVNGVTLRLSTVGIPVGLWRALRVTNEGFVMAAEDLVDASAYRQRAITNIADMAYDARRTYVAGLSHPRFRELHGVQAETFFEMLARSA